MVVKDYLGPTSTATEVDLYVKVEDINMGCNIIEKYGAVWAEVFYQSNSDASGNLIRFTDDSETLHCASQYKFSILDQLELFRGKDNKFEFLLEYPTDLPYQYNRWKQIDNPAEVLDITGNPSETNQVYAKGYEAIHIDWTSKWWGGLLRNPVDNKPCFIDGSIGHGNWFYAIGSYSVGYVRLDGKKCVPRNIRCSRYTW